MAGQTVRGLFGVDLDIRPGETVGLVGESGSGKTTLARVLMGIIPPDPGAEIQLDGHEVAALAKGRSSADQKALQIVFQNPDSALNRRHSVRQLISRSLSKLGGYGGETLKERLLSLVASVRLPERYLPMKPSQLSGGLKQRVAIARAFAGDPRIVVCDEPTSALDVSVQAAILNLLTDLQHRKEVAYLFISHDLGVVRYLADRIVVLYLGRVMEIGPADNVFEGPHHPYTEALLSAVPTLDDLDRLRIRLEGEIPSAPTRRRAARFTRCPRKIGEICETTEPELDEDEAGHGIRCHIPREELRRLQQLPGDVTPTPAAQAERAHEVLSRGPLLPHPVAHGASTGDQGDGDRRARHDHGQIAELGPAVLLERSGQHRRQHHRRRPGAVEDPDHEAVPVADGRQRIGDRAHRRSGHRAQHEGDDKRRDTAAGQRGHHRERQQRGRQGVEAQRLRALTEPDDRRADRDVTDGGRREGQADPAGRDAVGVQAGGDQKLARARHRAGDDQSAGRRTEAGTAGQREHEPTSPVKSGWSSPATSGATVCAPLGTGAVRPADPSPKRRTTAAVTAAISTKGRLGPAI